MTKQLFYLALLPPVEIQQQAKEIQQYFKEVYHSSGAFKSPPHITLQPPFDWEQEALPSLTQNLTEFAQGQSSLTITLDGFGCFRPRVIYLNVLKTPELLNLQKKLTTHLELTLNIEDLASKHRTFTPHLTIAYRDLTEDNFYLAWQEFETKKLFYNFQVSQLTLLINQDKRWHIHQQFDYYV